jgi:hypothetical protein
VKETATYPAHRRPANDEEDGSKSKQEKGGEQIHSVPLDAMFAMTGEIDRTLEITIF